MKTIFEQKADKNKIKGTYGYALMWFAVAFMIGVLPYFTNNGNFVLALVGVIAFVTGCYKLYAAIKKSSA